MQPSLRRWIALLAIALSLCLLPYTPAARLSAQGETCQEVTIAQIQGSGTVSPFDGASRRLCATACVTGIAAEGFFVQSLAPDRDPRTSEGIYVFRYSSWKNPRELEPGDRVRIEDFLVQEFYGQTEIVKLANDRRESYDVQGKCSLPEPIAIVAPFDPRVDPEGEYERYEGMRVSMAVDGSVTGPTQRYVSRYPAGDPEITLADSGGPLYGRRVLQSEVPAGRAAVVLSGGLGFDLPDAGTLDRVRGDRVTGVLAYQFGRYALLVDAPGGLTLEDAPDPVDPEPPLGPNEFGLCTFNAENLFDHVDDGDGDVGDWSPGNAAQYHLELAKRAATIREDLAGCTMVGLQEIEGKDAVWQALATTAGPSYRYEYWESADQRDITVGLLYDSRRVEVWHSEPAQACTPHDYGVSYDAARGPRAVANPCPAGQFPLFDRPPHLADLAVRNAAGDRTLDLRVIVNHLKSKSGDETENEPRRVLQARHVASLMTAPLSVAVGDLNDTLGSATLQRFGGFVNIYESHVAPGDRYSYIYQGRGEAIDHIIMSPAVDRYFLRGGPVHINADFPEVLARNATSRRSSDHDPLSLHFAFQPTGVTEAFQSALMGALPLR